MADTGHDDPHDTLTNDQLDALGLDDWRVLQKPLYSRFRTDDFATGLKLVDAIGEAADELDHHPDVDLRYGHVQVRLFSHDVAGRTMRDVELARRISAIAAELGIPTELDELTVVEHGIDTWDSKAILPFWRAVYGVPEHESDEVIDPAGLVPTIWFQETDEHEKPRQRWHPDVWVPSEFARERIDAAVAAGGTVVDDSEPSFTVLADPQGNRVCICIAVGR